MTATDELRRMLDERGVEWDVYSVSNTEYTHWTNNDGHWCAASIGGPLSLHVNILSATPEQAIAATLGARTCHVETTESWLPAERYHRCKHCGAFFAVLDASGDIPPRVCPNCGRQVVSCG